MRSRAVPSEHPTYITSNGVFAGEYDCASRMRSVYAPRVIRGGAASVHYRRAAARPSAAYPRAADGGAAARAAHSRQGHQLAAVGELLLAQRIEVEPADRDPAAADPRQSIEYGGTAFGIGLGADLACGLVINQHPRPRI